MSKYSYKIDFMVWSYSRVSSYKTCPYGWKFGYLNKEKSVQNFFSELGLHHHKIMELWWAKKLDTIGMASYYKEFYNESIKLRPPSFLEKYEFSKKSYENGLNFYKNFTWDIDDYELLGNEMTIEATYKDISLTIRPDTLVREKSTGKVILIDYKSSNPFQKKSGNPIKSKIAPYKEQLSLYAYFIEKELGIKIDEYMLIFPKFSLDKNLTFDYNKKAGQKVVDEFYETIQKIKEDEEFVAKPDKFFCSNICGFRNVCDKKDVKK